jgi:hypothetical protein
MSLFAEIMASQPPKKYTLDDVIVCDHVSSSEIERLELEIKIGNEVMAKEIIRLRAQLAKEKAAKLAILASWKTSMMRRTCALP